jgi:hypothetical protein
MLVLLLHVLPLLSHVLLDRLLLQLLLRMLWKRHALCLW